MGRASRRRQEKLTGTKQEKKVATYNYTEEQFRQEVKREVSELRKNRLCILFSHGNNYVFRCVIIKYMKS